MLGCRNMDMVQAPAAQDAGFRGAGVRVGVLGKAATPACDTLISDPPFCLVSMKASNACA